MQVALTIKEEKLRTSVVHHHRIFLARSILVIAFDSESAELNYAVFVNLKAIEIFLESIDPFFKLMLFKNNLPKLPSAELSCILFLVHSGWLEVVKGLVSDRLAKVYFLEHLVKVFDPLINLSVDHHARCHEARLDLLHLADIVTLQWEGHALELRKFIGFLATEIFNICLTKLHRDSSIIHHVR